MSQLDGEDFLRLFKDAIEFGGSKAVNAETKKYDDAVDGMFERLASERGYTVLEHDSNEAETRRNWESTNGKLYDSHDFSRAGFKTSEEAADFANEAKKQGVDVIVAPTKLNGQWIVQIPNETTVPVDPEPEQPMQSSYSEQTYAQQQNSSDTTTYDTTSQMQEPAQNVSSMQDNYYGTQEQSAESNQSDYQEPTYQTASERNEQAEPVQYNESVYSTETQNSFETQNASNQYSSENEPVNDAYNKANVSQEHQTFNTSNDENYNAIYGSETNGYGNNNYDERTAPAYEQHNNHEWKQENDSTFANAGLNGVPVNNSFETPQERNNPHHSQESSVNTSSSSSSETTHYKPQTSEIEHKQEYRREEQNETFSSQSYSNTNSFEEPAQQTGSINSDTSEQISNGNYSTEPVSQPYESEIREETIQPAYRSEYSEQLYEECHNDTQSTNNAYAYEQVEHPELYKEEKVEFLGATALSWATAYEAVEKNEIAGEVKKNDFADGSMDMHSFESKTGAYSTDTNANEMAFKPAENKNSNNIGSNELAGQNGSQKTLSSAFASTLAGTSFAALSHEKQEQFNSFMNSAVEFSKSFISDEIVSDGTSFDSVNKADSFNNEYRSTNSAYEQIFNGTNEQSISNQEASQRTDAQFVQSNNQYSGSENAVIFDNKGFFERSVDVEGDKPAETGNKAGKVNVQATQTTSMKNTRYSAETKAFAVAATVFANQDSPIYTQEAKIWAKNVLSQYPIGEVKTETFEAFKIKDIEGSSKQNARNEFVNNFAKDVQTSQRSLVETLNGNSIDVSKKHGEPVGKSNETVKNNFTDVQSTKATHNTFPASESKKAEGYVSAKNGNVNQSPAAMFKTITAAQLLNQYAQATGTLGESVERTQTYEREEAPISADSFKSSVVSYMDTFGVAVTKIDRAARMLSIPTFLKENASANQVFKTKLLKDGDTQSAAALNVSAIRSNQAKVINGETVIVNGKIVTDKKEREYVLNQHRAKMEKVDKNLAKAEKRDVKRAEKSRRTGKELKKDSISQKTIRKNSEKIKENAFHQEYIASSVKSQAALTGGVLDEYVNSFNTEAIVAAIKTSSIVLSTSEVNAIRKAMMSATAEQKQILKNVTKGCGVSSYRERETITEVLSNAKKTGKVRFSEEESKSVKEMLSADGKIRLNAEEMNVFSSSKQTMASIKKDFGFDFSKGGIGRADILKMNNELMKRAEKAGLQFTSVNKITGKANFDVEGFSKLNASQLQKLGISSDTRDMLAKLNSQDAWGGVNKNKPNSGLVNMALSGFMKLAGDDELSAAVSDFQKVAKTKAYVNSAATSVRNYSQSIQAKIDTKKANRVGKSGKTNAKVSNKKPNKKKLKEKALKPIDPNANAKYLAQQEKQLAKLAKSEKGVAAKFNKAKAEFGKKLANNKVAVALKKLGMKLAAMLGDILAAAGLVFLVIEGGIIIVAIAASMFQSLLNAPFTLLDNLTKAKSYQDTVCYQLAVHLADEEKEWADNVENSSKIYEERATLEYGVNRKSWTEYASEINSLVIDGDKLYINPFWQAGTNAVSTTHNSSKLTEVDGYDGKFTSEVCANLNFYGNKGTSSNGAFVGTESGHTSNTKDILAMLDVMFQFQMDGFNDGQMQSVLGLSKDQIYWRNTFNKAAAFFTSVVEGAKAIVHNVKSAIVSFFTGENKDGYKDIKDYSFYLKGSTVSYNALVDYVDTLFMYSHSQQFTLDVEYYPVANPSVNVNGTNTELTNSDIPQKAASGLGCCLDPVTKAYKIMYYNNKIFPYLEAAGGGFYDLSGDTFDIKLSMDNGTYNDTDQCLWNGMASNKETLDKIEENMTQQFPNTCWTKEEGDKTNYYGYGYADETDEEYAKALAYNKCVELYNSNISNPANMGTEQFVLSGDHNQFTHTFYQAAPSFDVSYEVSTYEWLSGYEYPDPIIIEVMGGQITIPQPPIPIYVTRYQVQATALLYTGQTDTYNRDCKGHDFTYCGGHVCVHSQGNVWSATNEQLALCEMYDNEQSVPIATDIDLSDMGYDGVLGKVDNKDNRVDYTNPTTASTTGGSNSSLFDVQGSDSSMRGLNFYVGSDGELLEGMNYNGSNINYLRDIFDIDCSLDKGWTVFPLGRKFKEYDGWNADNITLACFRVCQNWTDIYGFDIPYEMNFDGKVIPEDRLKGRAKSRKGDITALSEKDIKAISEALASTYGASYDDERKAAVELALRWVDRGHYNENHSDHAFLSEICKANQTTITNSNGSSATVGYDANCTAGDDEGFAKFILYRSGKITSATSSIGGLTVLGATSDCLPADILVHQASSDYRECVLKNAINFANAEDVITTLQNYLDTKYVVYIGTLNSDIKLSNGQTLHAGVPITIDLSENCETSGGTVYLRCENSEDWADISNQKNYYWVVNPDGKTKVKKFN